jgi:hypothetical protein
MTEQEIIKAATVLRDYCKAPFCGGCIFLLRGANTALKGCCRLDIEPNKWHFRGLHGGKKGKHGEI